jgi:alpha-L-rhamnosidase
MKLWMVGILGVACGCAAITGSFGSVVEPVDLRCEYLENPLGVDSPAPRLSWKLEVDNGKSEIRNLKDTPRGVKQTAYQILVATSEKLLKEGKADLWDSGRVESDQSIHVSYAGKPLASRMECFWKVRLWITSGQDPEPRTQRPSPWSAPARWTMGLLDMEAWKGRWIGADPAARAHPHGAVYLRKDMAVEKPVNKATVFFCGLGFSELSIDGKKVGDYVIGPGFTDYDKRVQYLVFDVTERMKGPGNRRLDVILADGWYALEKDPWVHRLETKPYVDKPKLLLDLYVEYQDGTEDVFVSDESWTWSEGEITRSWIAQEDIDLRPSGDAGRNWRPAVGVKGPRGKLVSQKEPPTRVVEEIKPLSMRYDPAKKSCVWDFGRTFNGWVRLQSLGSAGTCLSITSIPGVTGTDGAPQPKSWTSHFTLAGTGNYERYEPRFFHTGIRSIEVTGLESAPAQDDLVGCQISSMQTPAGDFACSDETVTALHDTVRRTVVSYTTFLPNDPMREWKAWTQDIQSMFGSAFYLFAESQTMYARWQDDMLDSQRQDGNIANVAPGPVFDAYNSPWWGGCAVWLPREWELAYGDDRMLRASYSQMKRYVDFLEAEGAKTGGLQDWGLGDWLAIEETPKALVNTAAHYHYAGVVCRTAKRLGLLEDADHYAAMADRVKAVFNQKFLDPETGIYGEKGWQVRKGNGEVPGGLAPLHSLWWNGDRPCTQAGQVLPLALGLVPNEVRPKVEASLLREIEAHKGQLSTGFVSTIYLLDVLMDLNPEMGWRLTTARPFPSWFSMTLGSGNDLMKETWAGGSALMPSLGGNFARWCYRGLAGIRPDPDAPGFKHMVIKPAVVGDLEWVKSHHDSPYGRIVSNWKRSDAGLTMEVEIPPNTMATVFVPTKDVAAVTESGKPIAKAKGVKFLRMENGAAVYEVGSGRYVFVSE